ncbi:hypothetical protein E4T43_03573 [Aureobasidium subglaciale]|nr:hypothetical protein E4T43_03573 [Aureobasidium subglaciale]
MKSYAIPLAASLFGTAFAASHSIDVGEDGLVFSPNSTTAAIGDTVTFHFYPRAHGVARSSYSSPCAAMDGGFNSDFVKVASGESATTFTITVNDTQPIWYYCPQGDHCQAGMVGVINPPSSSDQTVGGFIIAASSAGTSTVPNGVYGGVLAANGASGGAAAGGSSSSAQSASSSMSSSMASSMMASSMMSSSMMSSSMASSSRMSSMASSMASSAAVVGSSSRAMSGSSASAATGSASRTTSGAASATSSIVASTGAASSLKSVDNSRRKSSRRAQDKIVAFGSETFNSKHYAMSKDYDLVKRCLRQFAAAARADASGDLETGKQLWPTVLGCFERPLTHVDSDTGMFDCSRAQGFKFLDWQKGLDRNAGCHGLLLYCLKSANRLANLLRESTPYEAEVKKMTNAVASFWDVEGSVVSGPQSQRSFASVAWFTLSEALPEQVARAALLKALIDPQATQPLTPYLWHYVCDALASVGCYEECMSLITEYWGGMLEAGADTFWEAFDQDNARASPYGNVRNNSRCHA